MREGKPWRQDPTGHFCPHPSLLPSKRWHGEACKANSSHKGQEPTAPSSTEARPGPLQGREGCATGPPSTLRIATLQKDTLFCDQRTGYSQQLTCTQGGGRERLSLQSLSSGVLRWHLIVPAVMCDNPEGALPPGKPHVHGYYRCQPLRPRHQRGPDLRHSKPVGHPNPVARFTTCGGWTRGPDMLFLGGRLLGLGGQVQDPAGASPLQCAGSDPLTPLS